MDFFNIIFNLFKFLFFLLIFVGIPAALVFYFFSWSTVELFGDKIYVIIVLGIGLAVAIYEVMKKMKKNNR